MSVLNPELLRGEQGVQGGTAALPGTAPPTWAEPMDIPQKPCRANTNSER